MSIIGELSSSAVSAAKVGRLMSIGGLATGGAMVGGYYGSIANDGNIATGAAVGAVAGAAVLPAAGIGLGAGIGYFNNLDKVGNAMISIGKNAAKAASITGAGIANAANSTNRFVNVGGRAVNAASNLFDKMVKYKKPTVEFNTETKAFERNGGRFGLSGLGAGMIIGAGIIGSMYKAKDTFEQNQMGMMDDYITTATPTMPAYTDNGGATGDLVFALNRNRRG